MQCGYVVQTMKVLASQFRTPNVFVLSSKTIGIDED